MAFSIIHTRAISGLAVLPIRVETDLANGLPAFSIVGLPNAAVREARDRVRAAIINSGFEFPQRRVTVNLAPADLPKDSGRFDLPIAIGILVASGQLAKHRTADWEFVGELSLTGKLLPVRGAFALVMGAAHDLHTRSLLLPQANHAEALLTQAQGLGFAESLKTVALFLETGTGLNDSPPEHEAQTSPAHATDLDWSDIKGQPQAKRAALIAAAGGHNLLMMGPPGVGKSMIAQRLCHLLPELSTQQACELASVRSLEEMIYEKTWRDPPFRSPHHSTPARALIGGGSPVKPGEISLAHHGILFLDELAEFSRDTLESLREPLETGEISISRVGSRAKLPARLMLVAAMNPCPCGYFGSGSLRHVCKCTPDRLERYRSKISGPLLDRFDLAVTLRTIDSAVFVETQSNHDSQPIDTEISTKKARAHVQSARQYQTDRQACLNARLTVAQLRQRSIVSPDARHLMQSAAQRWGWSTRALHRTHRVAQTIADLVQAPLVDSEHVSEAIELRRSIDVA